MQRSTTVTNRLLVAILMWTCMLATDVKSTSPSRISFGKKPPAGTYSISVNLFKKRGTRGAAIPFRALLKRDGEDDISREGQVENEHEARRVEAFRFTVDNEGEISMSRVGTPLPAPKPGPV